MATFKLCVLGLFTLVIVRAICARGTLSERTYGLYILLGAYYGLLVQPVIDRVNSPYNENGPWISFFGSLFFLFALILPVYFAVVRSKAFKAMSLADVFLIAFCLGFGVDFGRLFVFSLTGPEPIPGYLSFPPFVYRLGEGEVSTLAGHGYWLAFVSLVFAACMRFVRKPVVAWVAGAAALLLMALEVGAYEVRPAGIWETVYKLGKFGAATPWLVLIGALALCAYEGKWAGANKEAGKFPLIEEWQALAGALFRGRFKEYARIASRYRTARRAEIIAAESLRAPGDAELQRGAERMAKHAGSEAETGVPPYGNGSVNAPRWWQVWGGWIALALVLVVLPKLPVGFEAWLWNFWGLHVVVPGVPFTLLTLVLSVVVVRRLMGSAGRPAKRSRPDDIASFVAERSLLIVAFGLVIAAVIYATPEKLFAYSPAVGEPAAVPLHGAKTMLVLLALAATGVVLNRTSKWAAAPIEDRRRFALRTSLDLLVSTGVVLLVNLTYVSNLQAIHTKYGPALFRKYQGSGNYVAAMWLALGIGIASFLILYIARQLSRRAENFIVGDPRG